MKDTIVTYGGWCFCTRPLLPMAIGLLLREEDARVKHGYDAGYVVGKC